MNASSESGLWATWIVFGIGSLPLRLLRLFRPLRLILEVFDHRLVFQILDPLRGHLRGIVPEKLALRPAPGGGVALEAGSGPPNDVAEQVVGGFPEDAVSQGIRCCKVPHPKVKHGGMVSG